MVIINKVYHKKQVFDKFWGRGHKQNWWPWSCKKKDNWKLGSRSLSCLFLHGSIYWPCLFSWGRNNSEFLIFIHIFICTDMYHFVFVCFFKKKTPKRATITKRNDSCKTENFFFLFHKDVSHEYGNWNFIGGGEDFGFYNSKMILKIPQNHQWTTQRGAR